jgi:hypothetical protein
MMEDNEDVIFNEYSATIAASHTCSLSGLIMFDEYVPTNGIGNTVRKSNIIRAIDDFALWTSMARQRGCLVVLANVLHSYSQYDLCLPVLVDRNGVANRRLQQCFNPNQRQLQTRDIPNSVLAGMEESFPTHLLHEGGQFPIGYSRLIQNAATQYATNFQNHCQSNFFIYQERSIVMFLKSLGYNWPKREVPLAIDELKRRINSWEEDVGDEEGEVEEEEEEEEEQYMFDIFHNPVTEAFIQKHRRFFTRRGVEDTIDQAWVDDYDNLHFIPLYFVHIQRMLEQIQKDNPHLQVKKINIVPLHRAKISFFDIDKKTLFYIMKRAGFSPGTMYQPNVPMPADQLQSFQLHFPRIDRHCNDAFYGWWALLFDVSRGESGSRTFHPNMGLRTDGVAACLIYRKEMVVLDDDWHWRPSVAPPQDSSHVNAYHHTLPQVQEQEEDTSNSSSSDDDPPPAPHVDNPPPDDPWVGVVRRFVAAVDPGLCDLFVLVLTEIPDHQITRSLTETDFQIDGLPGSISFSSAQYRHEGGVNFLTDYTQRIRSHMKEIDSRLSKHHFKVSKLSHFYNAVRVITDPTTDPITNLTTFEKLWQLQSRQWRRHTLNTKGKKKSSLGRAIARVGKVLPEDSEILQVGMGDGTFPGMAAFGGGVAVPTKEVKIQFGQQFPTQLVHEYCTSSVCPRCDSQLMNVHHYHGRKRYTIRGLKFCPSHICRDHQWWHR